MTIRGTRDVAGRCGVGLSALMGGLGLFISFVPGADVFWFLIAAGLAAPGLLSASGRTRAVAAGLAVTWVLFAIGGYLHNLRVSSGTQHVTPKFGLGMRT